MSNIINADSGAVSGIPGLKYTADASDTLLFQSNGNTTVTFASTGITLQGALTENVYIISDSSAVDINPKNGTLQLWTLGASRTPTANISAGQSLTLMINSSSYSVTWTSIPVTWVGGSPPTFSNSGYNIVKLWKTVSVVYGVSIGVA
jgi:hypothetical protein